jgi:hypothetical protein
MAGKTRLPKLVLSAEQLSELQRLRQSRTASLREVQRARMLCRYHEGETITGIARAMKISRKSVRKWIDKALAMGAAAALKDAYHRPHPPVHGGSSGVGDPSDLFQTEGTRLRRRTVDAESTGAACSARGAAGGTSFVEPGCQGHSATDTGRTASASGTSPLLSGKTRSPSKSGGGTYCWFIKRLRCRTKRNAAVEGGLRSSRFPSMRNRAFRLSPTRRPICPRFPESIPT